VVAGGGGSLPIIGALLGHTQPATTARYAHLAASPLREAAEAAGQVLTAGLAGEEKP
jgi:site-specific recombinase XerD